MEQRGRKGGKRGENCKRAALLLPAPDANWQRNPAACRSDGLPAAQIIPILAGKHHQGLQKGGSFSIIQVCSPFTR